MALARVRKIGKKILGCPVFQKKILGCPVFQKKIQGWVFWKIRLIGNIFNTQLRIRRKVETI